MNKIIIISYFFPPSNFVAGERISSWVKDLYKFGYFPVVITRNWNKGQIHSHEQLNENGFKHEVFPTHEVYRLPYNRNLRDKLFKYENNFFVSFFRKILTLKERILGNFILSALPYSNLFDYTMNLIKLNPYDYKCLIISGSPFQMFRFGYLIKKKFNTFWLPDYRDEWTIIQDDKNQTFLKNMMCKFDEIFEKRWTSNADGFISVSDYLVEIISKLIKCKGYKIMNGYDSILFESYNVENRVDNQGLVFTYNGTVYKNQDFSMFLTSLNYIRGKYPQIKLTVNFIGLGSDDEMCKKIKNLFYGFDGELNITQRIEKQKVINIMAGSDILILTSYGKIKGWLPVKIFDYLALNVPVLLCPSDDDEMSNFIKKTNKGFVANSVDECNLVLDRIVCNKLLGNVSSFEINQDEAKIYTREFQTKLLSNLLDNFLQFKK